MNLLIALFLIVFEAIKEGFKSHKWHIASEMVELVYLTVIALVFFGWVNGALPHRMYEPDLWYILIGYTFLRYAIFDAIFNISAGLSLFYIGKTKLYDKILGKVSDKTGGTIVFFTKGIALFWGLCWLLGWRWGIGQ